LGILDNRPIVETAPQEPEQNFFSGLTQSTLSAIPELFGVRAPVGAEQFRREHPILGFGSEMVGTAIPYAGWAKASRAVKGFDTAITALGDMEKAPIVTRAMQEAARFAPFEAGRVAVASGVNGRPLGEELTSSAINLGAAGVLAGVFGAFEAAGPASQRAKIRDLFPDVDVHAPPQIQMRQMREALQAGSVKPELQTEALGRLSRMDREMRAEEPGPLRRYIAPLEGEGADRPLSRQLERSFFRPDDYASFKSSGKATLVRKFTAGGKGFKDEPSWRQTANFWQLPEDFAQEGQYFRSIRVDTDKAARQLAAQADKLTKIGDWRIGREEDGLYVMLKRSGGETPAARDAWLAFKTDTPWKFLPESEAWAKKVEKHEAWYPKSDLDMNAGGAAFQFGRKLESEIPFHDYVAARKTGLVEGKLQKLTGTLGARAADTATYLLTPTINQAARNAKANYILKAAQLLFDNAEQRATDALLGPRPLGDAKGIISVALGSGERALDGGIAGRINAMTPEHISEFMQAWRAGADKDMLASMLADGRISKLVHDTYPEFEAEVTRFAKSRAETAKLVGADTFKELAGHGGLTRTWEGPLKIALLDDSGQLAAMADGYDRSRALKRAKFIKEELAKEGKVVHIGAEWDSTQGQRIPKELRVLESNPGFLQERQGVRGYKWDFGKDPTNDELIAAYGASLKDRARSEANLAWHALYDADHSLLATQDPTMFKIVGERVNAMSGGQDDMTKILNGWADPLLGPVLGTNSASRIVSATNEAFWHLQLGAGNIAYPVVNLIGTLQTVVPEIAFVMGAAPERAAGYYGTQIFKGARAGRGLMSVLDPIKVMAKGMRLVVKPTEEFRSYLSRAVNDGTVDPKWIEDMVGQNSRQVLKFKEVLSGKQPFGNYVRAVSEFLPGISERMSRGFSFAVGYDVGKNVLGAEGEALFQFAKTFTDRTMYRYSMADRPAVLTNPIGRLFGSMKNWTFHYLSNMLVYSDEAMRGNVAPLAWQMATTGLLGGVSAIPFIPGIANGFAAQTEQGNLLNAVYGMFGEKGGDAVYFGLPAVMGVSLSSATASPVRDANMLFSMAQWSRLQAMGGAVGEAFDYYRATGEHPGRDPKVAGLLARALAPKTLYRYAQVYDSPGIKSLSTGNTIIDQVNPWNKVLFTLGFTPNDIERGYATFEQLQADKDREKRMTKALGSAMREAMDQGNDEEVDHIFRAAQVNGVDVSTVMRSAASRGTAEDQSLLERNFSDQQRSAYDSVMQTWSNGQ